MTDIETKEDKKKTLEKLLIGILSFSEKSLENFVLSARFERLKSRQKNIFALTDFIHYYPDIYKEVAESLSARFDTVPMTKKEIETISLATMEKVFDMAYQTRIAPFSDFPTVLTELHAITSFFETENNMDLEGSTILAHALDEIVNKTIDHLEAKLIQAVIDIMDPESFKKFSLSDLVGIQKSIHHVLDTLGLDPYVEKIFNRIVEKEEADSLHVITSFTVLNEFLLGHIKFKEVLDDGFMLNKAEKRTRFEQSLKHFEDANKNILDDENIQYFDMSRSDILKLAHSLDVDSFSSPSKKRQMNLVRPKKTPTPK